MKNRYVELKNFKVAMTDFSVEVEDCVLKRDDFVWIEAASGYGKTTLLRAIAGFENGVQGEVWVDSQRIDIKPPHERELGVVFQDHLLFSHLNAIENVMVGLRLRAKALALDEKAMRAQAETMMKKLQLQDRLTAPITELSGGERQRLALLRALIWKPKMLLLDEPFKGLDPQTRKIQMDFLKQFLAEHPTPVLCVSHEGDEKLENATVHFRPLPREDHSHARKFVVQR